MFEVVYDSVRFSGGDRKEGGVKDVDDAVGKSMEGIAVGCEEFDVLLVKIIVILIVSEDF